MMARSGHAMKRRIKSSPVLWERLQDLRRRLRGRS
jgi:hypothetical protein